MWGLSFQTQSTTLTKSVLCHPPSQGTVEAVLWYFPYENDQETVPLDPRTTNRMMLTSNMAVASAAEGPGGHASGTQRPLPILPSQFCGKATQRPLTQGPNALQSFHAEAEQEQGNNSMHAW